MFKIAIQLAGIGQIALALSSLAIPRLLKWDDELARLRPLTRSVFRTYSAYIFAVNLWFGMMSVAAADALVQRELLPLWITGFITIYWGVRLLGQFAWYDRSIAGDRLIFRVGEIAYVTLFAYLTLAYGATTIRGLLR